MNIVELIIEPSGSLNDSEYCMQLIKFLTEEINNGGDRSWEYWHATHVAAKSGNCPFRTKCDIFKRSSRKGFQTRLF